MAVLCSELWLLIGVVFVLQLPVIRSQFCQQGWTFHAPTGTCMILIRDHYKYHYASIYCGDYSNSTTTKGKGHLVFIFDKATDDFVKGLLDRGHVDEALIGLNDRFRNGEYAWGDTPTTLANYKGWAVNPHIPNTYMRAVVITKDGWQEYNGGLLTYFVCQIDVDFPTPKMVCPVAEVGQESPDITCTIDTHPSFTITSVRFMQTTAVVASCDGRSCWPSQGYQHVVDVRKSQETSSSVSWSLKLRNVTKSDETDWTCSVKFNNQSSWIASQPCSLQVYSQNVGLEIKISPETTQMLYGIGNNRILSCIASVEENNQRPSLHWEIRGVQVTATDENARIRIEEGNDGSLMLRVDNVQYGDEGTYKCVATLGSQSDSRSLTVVVKKDLQVLSSTSQYGIFGTDGSVKCKAVAKSAPSTTWRFYNGTKIQSGTKYIIQQDQMIIKDLNEGDSAMYVCDIVVIETGEHHDFHIDYQVVQLPKITMIPTISPNNPKVGDSEVTITCNAKGSPQPTYEFRKGDNKIPEEHVDKKNGILTINDLKREDEGVYTCVAKNRGGSDEKSTHLDVRVAPIIQPISGVMDAVEGGRQRVTCMAEGDPAPTVIWQREDQLPYTDDDIKHSGPNLIDEAGTDREDAEIKIVGKTMDFTFITPQDAGTYTCTAINLVGHASTTVKFGVKYKPNFDTDYRVTTFYGWRGSTANLTCLASANEVATIKWYEIKDNRAVLIETEGPFTNREPQVWPDYYLSSSSLLVDVSDDTSLVFKDYTCEATNSLGSAKQTITLRRALPPGQPVVHVLSTLSTKVTIEIHIPKENGGQPVTGYYYSYRVDTAGAIPIEGHIDSTHETTNLELTDLQPNTQYILKVHARNAVGLGTETPLTVQTKEVSLPGKLELLSPAEGLAPTSYTLKWADVDDGVSPVTAIVIKYRKVLVTGTDPSQWTVSGDVDKSYTFVKVPNVKSTSYVLSGLERDTYYDIRITAINKEGESPETFQIIKTSPGAPVSTDSKDGGSQAQDVGAIVGGIVAALLAIIIFGVIIFLWRKKGAPCTRKKDQHANTPMYAVFKNDKPGSRHVVNELTEANAPENPQ